MIPVASQATRSYLNSRMNLCQKAHSVPWSLWLLLLLLSSISSVVGFSLRFHPRRASKHTASFAGKNSAALFSAPPRRVSANTNVTTQTVDDGPTASLNTPRLLLPGVNKEKESLQTLFKKQYSTHQSATSGLSKFHLSMVRARRQRFVAGQYPVTVTLHDNPTRRWLNMSSTTEIHVNGTPPERSLASLDRLQWLEPGDPPVLTLELLAELRDIPRPGYVHVLHNHTLWVTGFSVTDDGHVMAMDCRTGSITHCATRGMLKWPNEVQAVPGKKDVLVCDGFLVPTKDRGGVYMLDGGGSSKPPVRLTGERERWFYHRAVWVHLSKYFNTESHVERRGLSVLTARCRLSALEHGAGIAKTGELVWLEQQQNDSWKTHVLATGPDVMFAVADMDPDDDCIEVLASEFFSKRVVLYSIQRGPNPKVVFRRVIDEHCGQAFACILADMEPTKQHRHRVVDSGSTVECLSSGDSFSHLLVTSHECSTAALPVDTSNPSREGGSLFAYKIPTGTKDAWKYEPWIRTTIASGFKVNGKLNNMINPGAPGFVYTFPLKLGDRGKRPLIAVAGDCAESAYIFQPDGQDDEPTCYKLLAEIQCEATVGSLAISHNSFDNTEPGFARLFIPCYEKDRVLVFGFGDDL